MTALRYSNLNNNWTRPLSQVGGVETKHEWQFSFGLKGEAKDLFLQFRKTHKASLSGDVQPNITIIIDQPLEFFSSYPKKY
ncbi:MAG TPA: hypothetical protein VK468_03230 [Pyrinomonadaceae bacterium]|nr:hypothetical protein [Pyrinomonadaceae bacterium]